MDKKEIVQAAFHAAWGTSKSHKDYDKQAWMYVQRHLDALLEQPVFERKSSAVPPPGCVGVVVEFKLVNSEGVILNYYGRPATSISAGAMYSELLVASEPITGRNGDINPAVRLFNNVFSIVKELANTLQGRPARS